MALGLSLEQRENRVNNIFFAILREKIKNKFTPNAADVCICYFQYHSQKAH